MKLQELQVYFCTGARNQELLPQFNPDKVIFEIDERMAAFMALGSAKYNSTPVAVCTTSGTAVSECTSALIEAYYSNTPLILITGDRPRSMHGTGAPQTIEHEVLSRGHRHSFYEVSLSEFSRLDFNLLKYPSHINVLLPQQNEIPPNRVPEVSQNWQDYRRFFQDLKSPLFLLSHEARSLRPIALEMLKRNISFYAETLSGARDLSTIKFEKTLIKLMQDHFFDSVVRIGHTPLSKTWRLLERTHLAVFSFDERNLPALSYGQVMKKNSAEILHESVFWELLGELNIKTIDETPGELDQHLQRLPDCEVSLMQKIHDQIPLGSDVYLGNSLVIRNFELIQKKQFNIFGNRGVNGIDGQLSTAIGIARSSNKPLFCILGDLTTFYDLSALRSLPSNLKLIIINNGGGRIFQELNLDPRIWLAHESSFERICSGFNLSYSREIKEWRSSQVIEIRPDLLQTTTFRQVWAK
jgi:2-succinyl-5-enolpyruvyl-6-hydroxy-3-cyclohexene-1-carboxylate synthase